MTEKEKFYQKNWFMYLMLILITPVGLFLLWRNKKLKTNTKWILTIVFSVWFIIIGVNSQETEEEKAENEAKQEEREEEQTEKEQEEKKKAKEKEEEETKAEKEAKVKKEDKKKKETEKTKKEQEKKDVQEREFTVGKSNKDIKDLNISKPRKVRNDSTDRWKLVTLSKPVDINEYLISYAEEYYEEDDLVHVIINFTYGTTTMINNFDSYLHVRNHEYIDKEEHDADKIGKGMILGEYNIYKDNYDVVDFEKLVESEENS